jgi:hypothetical protein
MFTNKHFYKGGSIEANIQTHMGYAIKIDTLVWIKMGFISIDKTKDNTLTWMEYELNDLNDDAYTIFDYLYNYAIGIGE